MITLAADCLLFELASGESVPYSAEMISVELSGETTPWFDAEFLRDATQAVFHYFKEEMGRQMVSMAEFAEAMERVLQGFRPAGPGLAAPAKLPGVGETDLGRLALEASAGGELFFFRRLHDELRQQLVRKPQVLRFHGLRGCVKHLLGARRWTLGCRNLEEQIVQYLRACLSANPHPGRLALVVE